MKQILKSISLILAIIFILSSLTACIRPEFVIPETEESANDDSTSETKEKETEKTTQKPKETDADEEDETDPPESDADETDPPENNGDETDPPENNGNETDPPENNGNETDPPENDNNDDNNDDNNNSGDNSEDDEAALKKAKNDQLLAELLPKYEALRNEIKNKKSGYDLGSVDKSIGTPNSSWNATLPQITQDHPRLLVTKDTLPTVRKALQQNNATNKRFYELLDADISTINNGKLGTAQKDYDGRPGLHNYRKDYLEFIQIKALGYLVEGHELYGIQAIHCMKQYLRTLDIQYINSNMEREYGNVMFTGALVYDWCYDLLTKEDKTQLMAGIQNRTAKGTCGDPSYTTTTHYKWKMSVGYPPTKIGAVSGHGSERQVLRDYLSAAIAFYGDNNSWWEYIGALVYSEYVPVRNYYFQSGISQQGTGVYIYGRHISDMYSAWMLKTATGTQPYENLDKTIRNFLGYECAPGLIYSDGDGTYATKATTKLRALTYISAYLFADEPMLAQARYLTSSSFKFASDTIELTSAMYVALCGLADIEPAEDRYEGMPLIQYNGSPVGQYITHQAWNSASSASVFMKIKERSTANHEHADAGTFMIYYKGMLTADAGVYKGYSSDHTRYYHQATVGHNGLLIFDSSKSDTTSTNKATKWYSGGQIWPKEASNLTELKSETYLTGKVIGRGHGYYDDAKTQPKYAYIGGNITYAYDEATVDFVGRRMLTVYTGDEKVPMVFFVYDTITADSANYAKKFLLHITSPDAPTVNSTKKTVTTENGDGQLVLTCLSDNVSFKGVGGRTMSNGVYSPTSSKNYLINGVQNSVDYDDKTWGRVEITSTASTKSAKMLNVIYVTDKGNTAYYASKPITNVSTNILSAGDVEGAVFNKSVVAVFAKKNIASSGAYISGTISFKTEGNTSMQYYVDGLAGGNWQIKVDNKVVTTATSTSGILTFTAPAGTVTLTKVS